MGEVDFMIAGVISVRMREIDSEIGVASCGRDVGRVERDVQIVDAEGRIGVEEVEEEEKRFMDCWWM